MNLSVNGNNQIQYYKRYNKVKPRALFMLALFLGAAGVSQAGPQTTQPVPARQPLPTTVAGNPANQTASDPGPTKIIRIYRGEGYFDNALAEKLRPVLTGKSQPASSHGELAPIHS